jgi:hypothetical protein
VVARPAADHTDTDRMRTRSRNVAGAHDLFSEHSPAPMRRLTPKLPKICCYLVCPFFRSFVLPYISGIIVCCGLAGCMHGACACMARARARAC